MKRIYVNEEWCLGCHLCEYECAFANSGISDMVRALKGKQIHPFIHIEDSGDVHLPSTAGTARTRSASRAAFRAPSPRAKTGSCASTATSASAA